MNAHLWNVTLQKAVSPGLGPFPMGPLASRHSPQTWTIAGSSGNGPSHGVSMTTAFQYHLATGWVGDLHFSQIKAFTSG